MNQARLFQILRSAHVSEKAALLNQRSNQYVFKVARDATRSEIREAVEAMFNVSVQGVNVINVKGKPIRNAQSRGRRKGWKKACVRLQQGQQIDLQQAAEK